MNAVQSSKSTPWSLLKTVLKSWVSWRVAFAVLVSVVCLSSILSFFDYKLLQDSELKQLKLNAKHTVSVFWGNQTEENWRRLAQGSTVKGIVVRDVSDKSIQKFGETSLINVKAKTPYFARDRYAYIFSYMPFTSDDKQVYVQTELTSFQSTLIQFIVNAIVKIAISSVLITLAVMIFVGRWLLEPVLFMRGNLLEASKNPEDPKIYASPFNDKGEIGSAITITQNLIEQNASNIRQMQRSAEDKIHKLAYFDPLTTLPNRTFFVQETNQTIKNQREDKKTEFFVIAVDLDNFKDINDSMGHNVGDAILRSVGKKMKDILPVDAIVSRTGEDEFAVLVYKSEEIVNGVDIAQKLMDQIRSEPFKVFSEELQIRASLGVASYPEHGQDTETLLKNVDIALNRAKEEGRNAVKEYSEEFDRAVQARFQMVRDLRDALEYEQLSLYYQPQLDLKTGKIIGAEALIRWWRPNNSKEGGFFVSPGEFIPVAEQSGLIGPIGEWVISRACRDAHNWITEYGLDIRVAVNVSAVQFLQGDLKAYVCDTLKDTKLDPRHLELEVTESLFMEDVAHTIQTLKSLSEVGIELAIDDFGTGYSSLAYLRQFPIDRLKIDQSFIRNALNDPNDASIAKTIVALGRSLNLRVIAEGVETREHENFLIREGCDEVQGFRYSKPLPFDDFIDFCKKYDGHLDSFSRLTA